MFRVFCFNDIPTLVKIVYLRIILGKIRKSQSHSGSEKDITTNHLFGREGVKGANEIGCFNSLISFEQSIQSIKEIYTQIEHMIPTLKK